MRRAIPGRTQRLWLILVESKNVLPWYPRGQTDYGKINQTGVGMPLVSTACMQTFKKGGICYHGGTRVRLVHNSSRSTTHPSTLQMLGRPPPPRAPPNPPIKQPFSVHCSPSTSSRFLPRPQAFCTARTQMHESPSEDSTGPSSAQGRWGNGRMDRSVNKPVDGLKRFIFLFDFFRRHFSVLRRQLRSSLFKAKGLPIEGVKSQVASYPSK